MANITHSTNVSNAPNFVLYRTLDTAESSSSSTREHGVNLQGYEYALIEVVPSDGANPTVEVEWWSEGANSFVSEHTSITLTGKGADTSFAAAPIEAIGRVMHVRASTLATGSVKIYVAGYNTSLFA